MSNIEPLVLELSKDPFNPEKNFNIAVEYANLKQTASAASFFLRAAEYGYDTHPLIVYTSLLKMSLCFGDQNDRDATLINLLHQAIAYLPGRPEGYFLLSRWYERHKEWQKAYTFAQIGLAHATSAYNLPLPADVDYKGTYVLLFENAVSCWWVGRKAESKELFQHLLDNYEMAPEYLNGCLNNMRLFG